MSDYEKTRRWLLGLAENTVTANGSRATFVSDMYFEAAEAISTLLSENARLRSDLAQAKKRLEELGDF